MYQLNITRSHSGFAFPQALPDGENIVARYGFLLKVGEELDLKGFAERICDHYENVQVKIEAGGIRRWFDLMQFAHDHVIHFKTLPLEFEWEDGVYDYDDCLKILGDQAADDLLALCRVA